MTYIYKRLLVILLGTVVATTAAYLFSVSPLGNRLRNNVYDEEQRQLAQPADLSSVVVVDIDDVSLDLLASDYGVWPYQRTAFAHLHEHLTFLGARSVVYTPLFAETRAGDQAFAKQVKSGPPTVISASVINAQMGVNGTIRENAIVWDMNNIPELPGIDLPIRTVTDAGAKIGISVRPLDYDEVFRAYPPVFKLEDRVLPAMPVAVLYANKPEYANNLGDTSPADMSERQQWHKAFMPYADNNGRLYPIFPPNANKIKHIPFWQLMFEARDIRNGVAADSQLRSDINGKIVFVGVSATLLDKAIATPHARLSTHELLANLYLSLEQKRLLKDRRAPWSFVLAILVALLPLMMLTKKQVSSSRILLVGLLMITGVAAMQIGLVALANVLIDPVQPILSGLLAVLFGIGVRTRQVSKANQALEIERRTAERASELKTQFLENITHELRTPLTSVLGYNRLLLDEDSDANDSERFHKIIDANCRHLLTLIGNLLSEAEIEAGRVEFKPSATQPADVLTEAVHSVEGLALNKQLSLNLAVAPHVPPWLMLDGLRLRQVIINLASNAVKYTEQGHVSIRFDWLSNAATEKATAEQSASDGTLQIDIKDTGPGMSEAQLDNIFGRFANRHEVRLDSSGIGLSICYELVEIMGGTINVKSVLGEGTSFEVSIPATLADDIPAAEILEEEALPATITAEILVVDDSPDIQELVGMFLLKAGYDVTSAESGEAAIEIALQQWPDMIIMDLNLPGISGAEAVGQLRDKGFTAPIILCSAAANVEDIAGIDGYLPKPMRREALLVLIADLLSKDAAVDAVTATPQSTQ